MHMFRSLARLAVLAPLAASPLVLASCGSTPAPAASGNERLAVVVGFYPLQYAVERIGGTHVAVTNLTKPGAEPHDLELTPQDVATASSAKLAVYEKGLQPSLDAALAGKGTAYDVSTSADLSLKAAADAEAKGPQDTDPHFWLDPVRYAKVGKALAAKLGELDPAHKADFEKNATAFATDLDALDQEFRKGLSSCASKNLVTSHAAFAYLADRYGLTQTAIAGLSPDQEPAPARLAQISAFVKANKVTTIYTETLASPAVAKTVAAETGAKTAVLDPLEGLSDASAGKTYLDVMRVNLTTLRAGQSCS